MRIKDFTSTNKPIVVVVNILNPVARKIVDALLEQEARVILVDYLNKETKSFISKYKHNDNLMFIDISFVGENLDAFAKIDYIYFFVSHLIVGSSYPSFKKEVFEMRNLTSKEFFNQSNYVDMFLKLAIEFNSKYTLITSGYLGQLLYKPSENNIQLQRYSESLFMEYFVKSAFNGRIVRIGEPLGDDMDLSVPTFATRMLREITESDTVTILGDGLQNNYIVNVDDAAFGVLKASFSKQLSGKIVHVANESPVSTLNLVYNALELVADEKQIEFIDIKEAGFDFEFQEEFEKMSWAQNLSLFGWEIQSSLTETLQKALAFVVNKLGGVYHKSKTEQVKEITQGKQVKPIRLGTKKQDFVSAFENKIYDFWAFVYSVFVKKPLEFLLSLGTLPNKAKKVSFWIQVSKLFFIIAIIFTLLPYAEILYGVIKIDLNIKQAKKHLQAKQYDATFSDVLALRDGTSKINYGVSWIKYWQYIGLSDQYKTLKTLSSVLEYESLSIEKVFRTILPVLKYKENVDSISGANLTYLQQVASYSYLAQDAYQDHKLAMDLVSEVDIGQIPVGFQDRFLKYKEYMQDYNTFVTYYKDFYGYLPYFLGYRTATNYFVAYQNNYEIRPTAGWMTAYSLFSFNNGNLVKSSMHDVYDTDGHIKGIKAPSDMAYYTGHNTIKLATSTWDPDYRVFYDYVNKLLLQAKQVDKVDTLIVFDLTAVESLLDAIGGVHVDGYGNINGQNLFDIMVMLHKEFKPGVTNKRDFLQDLADAIKKKLERADLSTWSSVMSVLGDMVNKKHMLVYNKVLDKDNLLSKYNLSFVLNSLEQELAIIEFNSGGNKANRTTTRFCEFDINVQKNILDLKLSYKNKSNIKSYPYGDYKSIVRVYYPVNWEIKKVQGLKKVKKYKSHGLNVVAGELKVSVGQETVLNFEFANVDFTKSIKFAKQPGYLNQKAVFTVVGSDAKAHNLEDMGFSHKLDSWVWLTEFNKDIVLQPIK